jgi:hypothetical protein
MAKVKSKSSGRFVVSYPTPKLGTRFTNWTVISTTYKSPNNNNRRCDCQCVCGNKGSVLLAGLYSGKSRGCGCVHHTKRARPYESTFNVLLRQAAQRGYEVTLTYEEFLIFTKISKCHYCKSALTWSPYNIIERKTCRHNIDRMDNDKGYSRDNCVVCCARCNRAKSNHFTYDEWKSIGRLIQSWEK